MPEAPLLLIQPFARCAALLSRLRAHGWAVEQAGLAEAVTYRTDVALVYLPADSTAQLSEVLCRLQHANWCWIALVDEQQPFEAYHAALFAAGCVERVVLPTDLDSLPDRLDRARACTRLRRCPSARQPRHFLGRTIQTRNLRRQLEQYVMQSAPVLIRGEAGSGKSLVAQLLHGRSIHPSRPLIQIDCHALAAEQLHACLLDSAEGVLWQSGATLQLEGASTMPTLLQEALLDYLRGTPTVRLLTLEQGELTGAVQAGRFLEPLYRELSRLHIEVPPLRRRRGDILLLAEYFATRYDMDSNRGANLFTVDAAEALLGHAWPGNLHELRHRVLRALVCAQGRPIDAVDLDLLSPSSVEDTGNTLADYVLRAERQALNDALLRNSSNMSQAARALGVSRPTFYRLLHKHRMR